MEARFPQNDLKIPIYCSSLAITQMSCHSPTVDKGSYKSHFISKVIEEIYWQLKNKIFWHKVVYFLASQLVMISHE